MVPGFLNFPLMYLIRLSRVQSYSLLQILLACVASGPLNASSMASARLVRYSMLKASACFFATCIPEYFDWIPVIIFVSLKLSVTR